MRRAETNSPEPETEARPGRSGRAGLRAAVGLAALCLLLSPTASRPQSAGSDGGAAAKAPAAKSGAAQPEKTDDAQSEAKKILQDLREAKGAPLSKTATGKTIEQAPKFSVVSRKGLLMYYPCSQCHDPSRVPNRQIRVLKEEHTDLKFHHGGGRFWCYTCHNAKNMDTLHLINGESVDFDAAYKVCGQCHFERELDWAFGGHGKRAGAFQDPHNVPLTHKDLLVTDRSSIGHWQGKRVLLDCTGCHNPHSPYLGPFKPSPPPIPRRGLHRPPGHPIASPPPGLPLGERGPEHEKR